MNRRARVLVRDEHNQFFLECLETVAGTFRVQMRCCCCMPNHFYLNVSTPEANLSRFMQGFLTTFSVGMNRRTRSSGHVFQGRYKAQLVEDEACGASLSRYIHLNPVRCGVRAGIADMRTAWRISPGGAVSTSGLAVARDRLGSRRGVICGCGSN